MWYWLPMTPLAAIAAGSAVLLSWTAPCFAGCLPAAPSPCPDAPALTSPCQAAPVPCSR